MSDAVPYDSRADTLAHMHAVRDRIGVFIAVMLERARKHDASKFSPEEKPAFDAAMPRLRGMSYGSAEYRAVVREMWAALQHHYQENSHHPEHYGNEGVAGMDLFDVVEMVCDWMAASLRNQADGVKLDHNVELYHIEPQLASIIANTLARWPGK